MPRVEGADEGARVRFRERREHLASKIRVEEVLLGLELEQRQDVAALRVAQRLLRERQASVALAHGERAAGQGPPARGADGREPTKCVRNDIPGLEIRRGAAENATVSR